MADKPGVFPINEPLHPLLHVGVGEGPPHARHECIEPLGFQAEVDVFLIERREEHNVFAARLFGQSGIRAFS